MNALTRFALDRSRLTLFACLVLVVWGLADFTIHPSREDPEITIRTAAVSAHFPGLPAERIEALIARPIEEEAKQIAEVSDVESISTRGRALVKISVEDRYFDLEPIWSDLRNKMEALRPRLPQGVQGPFVNDDYGRVAVATLALTGPGFTAGELRREARRVRDGLGALPLVARIDLHGVQEERIWLEFDPGKLSQFGLDPQQLAQALSSQNVLLPAGTLTAFGQQIGIQASGDFRSLEEIADLAIWIGEREQQVYLRDVVAIRRGAIDPPDKPVLFNGRAAVVLAVSMSPGVAIGSFAEAFEQEVRRLRQSLPLGMSLDLATYQPPRVAAAINDAVINLLQTLATVLIVVIFFLGIRTGLVVGAIVPLTILAALIGMALLEIPLHRISIAAVIIALGLLVDNGIVVAENIQARLGRGEDARAAAIAAGAELALPLLCSTLTTVLAFLPLILAEDTAAEYVGALTQVVALSLLASWLLSITVTPAMCRRFLPAARTGNAGGSAGLDGYVRALEVCLRHRFAFLGATGALLALALFGLSFVTPRLMPNSDRAQIVVHLKLPAGTEARATLAQATRLSQWLADAEENPEVVRHVIYVADGGPRFFLALSPVDADPHVAFAVVTLGAPHEVAPVMERIGAWSAANLPGMRARAERLFLGATAPGTVSIRLTGERIADLAAAGEAVEGIFRARAGARYIRGDWDTPILEAHVEIDQQRARRAGVTSEDIARTLAASFDGLHITDYRDYDTVIPIVIRAGETQRDNFDQLRALTVFSSSRKVAVPLLQVADFSGAAVPYRIKRFNQRRAITVSAFHPDLQAAEFYEDVQPGLTALDLPADLEMSVEGEIKASQEANGALFRYMPHCLVGIIALLIWQFNSFRRPAIVALTIPLIIIGASAGLLLTGAFFDFVAILGLLSLGGIILNNGIVLIDRIDRNRQAGGSVHDAVVAAARTRARPIIMTTVTTSLGLVPLMLFGGAFWFSMTVVIIGGLIVGTALSLGVIPVLYSLLFGFEDQRARGYTGGA